MIARIVCLCLFTSLFNRAFSQDRIKLIGIETGINLIECQSKENDRIRSSYSDYYGSEYFSGGMNAFMSRVYGGIKAEVRASNNVFGFATGVRYSVVSSSVSSTSSPAYFYYMFRQSETTTEFLRIKEITQKTSYVSVPLEVRVFPYRERVFRLYFLAGTELGFKVASKNEIAFHNPAMEQYEGDVAADFKEADSFFSTLYGRAGFVIGKDKPFLDIGLILPVAILSSATTLSESQAGGGFHFQIVRKF